MKEKRTSTSKRIAVILSGCGNKDGSEIIESASLIIALSKAGAQISYFAPNIEFSPKNFLTNQPLLEKRNVMIEAARITRSQMNDLKNLKAESFDGVALPGGYGVALNLSTWATQGSRCVVNEHLTQALNDFFAQSKPIAAICIAPAIVAKVLGRHGVTVTIGDDKETAQEIEKTGARHENCPVSDYVTDRMNKIITTPAYMLAVEPHQVFEGISGVVKEFIEMA